MLNNSVTIYTLSNTIPHLNKELADYLTPLENIIDLDKISTNADAKPNAIIFEVANLQNVLSFSKNKNITSELRFICIGDNLDVEQRLSLLNQNIEFISRDKFSELSVNYFTLGLGQVKKKVLFVDDDENQIEITEHILKSAGLDVKSITKGEDVMDALDRYNPDLLLMDLYLDDITGDKLVKIIRKVPKHRFLPIVFLSADSSPESRMLVLDAGADDLITKPIRSDLLVAAINNRIQRSLFNQFYQYEYNANTILHPVQIKDSDLQSFFNDNSNNSSASVVWLKVTNRTLLQKQLGYSGFRALCNSAFSSVPGLQLNFEIKSKLTDGVYGFASSKLPGEKALRLAKEIGEWFDNNLFTVNDKNYSIEILSIILSDIASKRDKHTLLRKAETLLIEPFEGQNPITLLEDGIEENRFYAIKSSLEQMIKTRDIGWKFFPIVATQNQDEVVYQMIFDSNSSSGKHISTREYLDVAEKTGLLKVFDRFALERAIRMIRMGELKRVKTHVLLNQVISHYNDKNEDDENTLEIYEGLKLPEGSLFIQFELLDAIKHFDMLGTLSHKIRKHGIKICLSGFDYSDSAWKVARKINASWIRINPPTVEDMGIFAKENLDNLQHTTRKAHVLGYKVIAHCVNNPGTASLMKKSNIDYLQGNHIKPPIPVSEYLSD